MRPSLNLGGGAVNNSKNHMNLKVSNNRKWKYKVYDHLGKGEEEPLPLALLPVARFEGGGEGEQGVRRQAGLQVQAHVRLTWVQVDRPDRLGPLLLPRVDHQLGRRLDRGGRPPYCACQAAVFYNLREFSSILLLRICKAKWMTFQETNLLNFHICWRSDLDKGLVKKRLRFARVAAHLK